MKFHGDKAAALSILFAQQLTGKHLVTSFVGGVLRASICETYLKCKATYCVRITRENIRTNDY